MAEEGKRSNRILNIGTAVGIALGAAFIVFTGNFWIGLALGLAIGIGRSTLQGARAEKHEEDTNRGKDRRNNHG